MLIEVQPSLNRSRFRVFVARVSVRGPSVRADAAGPNWFARFGDRRYKGYFETIDHAFVQGTWATAQVVTASPPFCGYHNPAGNFNLAAAAPLTRPGEFTPLQTFPLMWD